MDGIDMNDIPLVSKKGWWIIKSGGKRRRASQLEFQARLKSSLVNYEDCQKKYGGTPMTKRAKALFDFHFNQIDENTSDTFTLLMFRTDEWMP